LPVAFDPGRDLSLGHALTPANALCHLAGQRLDVGSLQRCTPESCTGAVHVTRSAYHTPVVIEENVRAGGMVGAARFEPETLCSQSRCATGLRYAPNTWKSFTMSFGCRSQGAGSAASGIQSAVGNHFMVNSMRPSPKSRQLSTSVM